MLVLIYRFHLYETNACLALSLRFSLRFSIPDHVCAAAFDVFGRGQQAQVGTAIVHYHWRGNTIYQDVIFFLRIQKMENFIDILPLLYIS